MTQSREIPVSFSWIKQQRSSDGGQTARSWAFLAGLRGSQDSAGSCLLCSGPGLPAVCTMTSVFTEKSGEDCVNTPPQLRILLKQTPCDTAPHPGPCWPADKRGALQAGCGGPWRKSLHGLQLGISPAWVRRSGEDLGHQPVPLSHPVQAPGELVGLLRPGTQPMQSPKDHPAHPEGLVPSWADSCRM